jgi:hypothetical protein
MNTNTTTITDVLMYKQLNPPEYRMHRFRKCSYLGTVLSIAVLIRINVHGQGIISQYFVYDINNKIVKYRYSYYSEEQRIKDREKNMAKDRKKRKMEKKEGWKTKERWK